MRQKEAMRGWHGLLWCGLLGALTPAGATQAAGSAWSFEVGAGMGRAGTVPLEIRLGGPVALAGVTEMEAGQSLRATLGRQFEREQSSDDKPWPWRLELEGWQHRGDRRSIRIGQRLFNPGDTVDRTALMVNALLGVYSSEARNALGHPDWRLWLGVGAGWGTTKQADASTASCPCLPARSDNGTVTQIKVQLERRLSENAFFQLRAASVRVPGAESDASRSPITHYGAQALGEVGVSLRWAWK